MKKLYCVVASRAISDVKAEQARQQSQGGWIMGTSSDKCPPFPDIWEQLADKIKQPQKYWIAGYETLEEAKEHARKYMKGASVWDGSYVILEMLLECVPVKTEEIAFANIP